MDIDDLQLEELDEEPPAQLSRKDRAFVESAEGVRELSFGGRDGGPVSMGAFNTPRQIAAQAMGMEFFNMGQDALEEFQDRGTYNGIFQDAVLVCFLCSQPVSTAKKALRARGRVLDMAMTWADRNRILVGNARHAELMEVFGEIVTDIIESVAEVDEPGTGGQSGGESLGE